GHRHAGGGPAVSPFRARFVASQARQGVPESQSMNMAPVHWRTFLVPKDGHTAGECEDAVAGDPAAGRFEVADGASESFAAGEWARLLCEAFVEGGPVADWLATPREAWKRAAAGG